MNHYMPSTLLDSQLACLDPPAADERVVTIGVAARPAEIAAEIIRRLTLRPEPFSSALGASAPGYSSAPPLGDFWNRWTTACDGNRSGKSKRARTFVLARLIRWSCRESNPAHYST